MYSYASNKFFFSVGMIYTFLGFPGGKRKMPSFPFLIMPLASCIQSDERAHSFTQVWKASHERRCAVIQRSKEWLDLVKVIKSEQKSCFSCARNRVYFQFLKASILAFPTRWEPNLNFVLSLIWKILIISHFKYLVLFFLVFMDLYLCFWSQERSWC